ncbi:MAG: hypothetical protein WBK55_02380 [Alphaproteobacteria bacterium]
MNETGYEKTYSEFCSVLENGQESWDVIEKLSGYKFVKEKDNFVKDGGEYSKLEVHKSMQKDKKQQYLIYDHWMCLFR